MKAQFTVEMEIPGHYSSMEFKRRVYLALCGVCTKAYPGISRVDAASKMKLIITHK